MAARMKVLGAKGIVADGRVRDLETLGSLGLPVSGLLYERGLCLASRDTKSYGVTEYMVEGREQENTAWENMSMAVKPLLTIPLFWIRSGPGLPQPSAPEQKRKPGRTMSRLQSAECKSRL